MRKIELTSRFRRDLKRVRAGFFGRTIDGELANVVDILANDLPLSRRYADHPLSGGWADHRDCHIRPDLVLIYRKTDDHALILARLGSHSELGL